MPDGNDQADFPNGSGGANILNHKIRYSVTARGNRCDHDTQGKCDDRDPGGANLRTMP